MKWLNITIGFPIQSHEHECEIFQEVYFTTQRTNRIES